VNAFSNNRRPHFYFLILIPALLAHVHPAAAQNDNLNDSISKAFYDTLKTKAEKRKITGLIYDMIFVNPPSAGSAREKMSSTAPFEEYSGRVIRKREIIRLNAFGTDIDDPLANSPTKAGKFLNSTYAKTRKFVLYQYLLFRQGDTISPLKMADNERLLRGLSFIDDARIIIVPVDGNMADVAVIVRETYPVGFDLKINGIKEGSVGIFDRNFAGLGHELEISMPYRFDEYRYPGIGARYSVKNIMRSLSDLEIDLSDGLGSTTFGGLYKRDFVTSETRYAWYASVRMTYTSEDLDTMPAPVPLRYTYQDYQAARSFMIDPTSVTRLIVSGRYVNNNVFKKPVIDENSYYRLQKYHIITGSLALSSQRFINTSLIYSYGRTEDIPYGYMLEAIGGREINEFKSRNYAGVIASYGNIFKSFGYIYGGISLSSFINHYHTEQGTLEMKIRYFTPLMQAGRSRIRTFVNFYYMRGFDRYTDEFLYLRNNDLIRGFRNDSVCGSNRIVVTFEPVLFTYKPLIGFRFAFFTFADAGWLVKGSFDAGEYFSVLGLGAGVRIRNDQLVFNTIQIRFAYYPYSPPYSETSWFTANGIVRLKPPGFEPGPPGVIPYQ
jgi:hypothetical protein